MSDKAQQTAPATSWLTPPQIAEMLRIDPAKVVGWIKSGRLMAVNVSDGARPRFRISPDELNRFLESRSTTPLPKPVRARRKREEAGYY